jgi:hypothetical protein
MGPEYNKILVESKQDGAAALGDKKWKVDIQKV